jgi:hypothetical protein|eukprot:COSAG03_NODE_2263_length_2940_cov_2.557550_3_plen_81_part_00
MKKVFTKASKLTYLRAVVPTCDVNHVTTYTRIALRSQLQRQCSTAKHAMFNETRDEQSLAMDESPNGSHPISSAINTVHQ